MLGKLCLIELDDLNPTSHTELSCDTKAVGQWISEQTNKGSP